MLHKINRTMLLAITLYSIHSLAGFALSFDEEQMQNPQDAEICYRENINDNIDLTKMKDLNTLKIALADYCPGHLQAGALSNVISEKIDDMIFHTLISTVANETEIARKIQVTEHLSQMIMKLPGAGVPKQIDTQTIQNFISIGNEISQSKDSTVELKLLKSFQFHSFKQLPESYKNYFLNLLIQNLDMRKCSQLCQQLTAFLKQLSQHEPEMKQTILLRLRPKAGFNENEFKGKMNQQANPVLNNNSSSIISKQCQTANEIDRLAYHFGDSYQSLDQSQDRCQQIIKIKSGMNKGQYQVQIKLLRTNDSTPVIVQHQFHNAKHARDYYRQLAINEMR